MGHGKTESKRDRDRDTSSYMELVTEKKDKNYIDNMVFKNMISISSVI